MAKLCVSLTALLTVASGTYTLSLAEKTAILDKHNELRENIAQGTTGVTGQPAATYMHELFWDDGLAKLAEAYANGDSKGTCGGSYGTCNNNHLFVGSTDLENCFSTLTSFDSNEISSFSVGENIALSNSPATPSVSDWENMITGWYDEIQDYTFEQCCQTDPALPVVGHYTQVAWADTRFVGCGARQDSSCGWDRMLICLYFPAGNLNGAYPYQELPSGGTPGEDCDTQTERPALTNGLCTGAQCERGYDYFDYPAPSPCTGSINDNGVGVPATPMPPTTANPSPQPTVATNSPPSLCDGQDANGISYCWYSFWNSVDGWCTCNSGQYPARPYCENRNLYCP